jgi:uncharacterized protein
MTTTLIIPGLNSSGPDHWQSWFEAHIPGTVRVIQADWNKADLPEWAARVRRDITRTPGRLFIVAHSFGVLAAVQAAVDHADRISGAVLVAPADPEKFGVDELLPQEPLPFPSVVVGSTNDHWMTLERAAHWADLWGSDFVNLGAAGHINAESGFGPWPEGLALFERLQRRVELTEIIDAASDHSLARTFSKDAARTWRRSRDRAFVRSGRLAERSALKQAAALLQEAGWNVTPPAGRAHVLSA